MKCFLCDEIGLDGEGTNICFFDVSRGYFVVGSEPRFCDGHKLVINAATDEQRAKIFARFDATDEAPSGASDPLADVLARKDEAVNRGKS